MDEKIILQQNIMKLKAENKKLKEDLAEVNEMYNRASLLIIQKNKAIVKLEEKYNDLVDSITLGTKVGDNSDE